MKNLFRNIPLHIKLLLIGIIPLAFAFFVALQNNRQKEERLTLLKTFKDNVVLNSHIGELSGSLLTERRVSFARRLHNRYSEAQLLQQQAKSDEAIEKVQEYNNERLGDFKRYTHLNSLPAFRKRVLRDSLSEVEILDFYTPIIQRLIMLVVSTSEKPYFIPELGSRIAADYLLLQMSNSMAVLRSDIYYALVKKEVTASFFEKIRTGWKSYRSMEMELFEKADSSTIKAYRDILKQEGSVSVMTLLDEIDKTGNILLSADAENWWNNSIRVVDDIKNLKGNVVSSILSTVQERYENEREEKNIGLALLMTVIVIVIMIIYFSIRSIASSLNEIGDAATRLSIGELGLNVSPPTRDIVGKLARAVMTIDTNKQKLAAAAADIGNGKFDTPLKARSEKDVIGNAMLNMRTNLIKLSAEQEEKLWLQRSVREVSEAMMGEQNAESIAENVLGVLARIVKFEVAAFYITKSAGQLQFLHGYAMDGNPAIKTTVALGESLAGQALAEKRMLLIDTPEKFYPVRSAAGGSEVRQAMILPLINNDQVEGLIEMGKLKEFEHRYVRLLEEVSEKIAIALLTAQNRAKLQDLLEETQAQAEELQVQHTEMENLNTELEAHTQKLQASEEELRVQQEELQQANAELEERTRLLEEKNQEIAERTLEIQAKAEQLEATTKYKSEFLANMSHELRTPLNSILLLSRLMCDNTEKNLTEDQVEYARVIQSSGQGLLLLIDEILDLSKIEAGKMSLEIDTVDVHSMLATMKAMFEPMAREKNLQFHLNVSENIPETIETDKLRLEQIIRNLISNSLKFTSQGSITIDVKSDGKKDVVIAVSDTGIGIAADKLDLIFDAFQQADGSTRRKFGGTGLGLSISRELVKLLGGKIAVESTPGKGSKFIITVPVKRNNNGDEQEHTGSTGFDNVLEPGVDAEYISFIVPSSIPDDRDKLRKDAKTILIIEDDVNFAKSLLEYTRQSGYNGLCAVRGDEGIELAKAFRPAGILLDIQLPVKSGWQVMEELKNDARTRHIPVHIMSSHQVKNESLLKGAINFVHKPVAYEQMNDIFKRIEQIISKESRKVLILEENPQHARALAYFLESSRINTEIKHDIDDGVAALQADVDCVVLDMGIPNKQAYDMLESIKMKEGMENIPVIIFTGKSLSPTEQERIGKYADSIILKTAQSYQRILSEVSLFLHLVETSDGSQKKGINRLGGLNEVLNGKKVLIVDDDVRNIFSLSRALEQFNVNVVTATDGREALERLSETNDIDVVLLDMMMPRMDGYETAKKIRLNSKYKNLPVIAVTAKAMTGDREKCIRAGASDYITKPVDTDQLLSLLRVWLYETR